MALDQNDKDWIKTTIKNEIVENNKQIYAMLQTLMAEQNKFMVRTMTEIFRQERV